MIWRIATLLTASLLGLGLARLGLARLSPAHPARQSAAPTPPASPATLALQGLQRTPTGVAVHLSTGDHHQLGWPVVARVWATGPDGAVYAPQSILRQATSLPLRETHLLPIPAHLTAVSLTLSAGLGTPDLVIPNQPITPATPASQPSPTLIDRIA